MKTGPPSMLQYPHQQFWQKHFVKLSRIPTNHINCWASAVRKVLLVRPSSASSGGASILTALACALKPGAHEEIRAGLQL